MGTNFEHDDNDHDDSGQRHDHWIHAGERDCAQGNEWAVPVPFGKTVTYVTKSGKTLDEAAVKTRIKLGIPVRVHYTGEGDNMLVDRVELDED